MGSQSMLGSVACRMPSQPHSNGEIKRSVALLACKELLSCWSAGHETSRPRSSGSLLGVLKPLLCDGQLQVQLVHDGGVRVRQDLLPAGSSSSGRRSGGVSRCRKEQGTQASTVADSAAACGPAPAAAM